jgi:hypothetical protein
MQALFDYSQHVHMDACCLHSLARELPCSFISRHIANTSATSATGR